MENIRENIEFFGIDADIKKSNKVSSIKDIIYSVINNYNNYLLKNMLFVSIIVIIITEP